MMKKNTMSASDWRHRYVKLTVLAAFLLLAILITLTVFGPQAAATGQGQSSLGALQAKDACIDGYVFGVVNGGD